MCFRYSKDFKARVELESRKRIMFLRIDNEGEYTDEIFFTNTSKLQVVILENDSS